MKKIYDNEIIYLLLGTLCCIVFLLSLIYFVDLNELNLVQKNSEIPEWYHILLRNTATLLILDLSVHKYIKRYVTFNFGFTICLTIFLLYLARTSDINFIYLFFEMFVFIYIIIKNYKIVNHERFYLYGMLFFASILEGGLN
jgi:hypothetical protein